MGEPVTQEQTPTEALVIARLRRELTEVIEDATPRLRGDDTEDTEAQPTLGFQRVLQRAVFHVQSSGRKVIVLWDES